VCGLLTQIVCTVYTAAGAGFDGWTLHVLPVVQLVQDLIYLHYYTDKAYFVPYPFVVSFCKGIVKDGNRQGLTKEKDGCHTHRTSKEGSSHLVYSKVYLYYR